MNKMIEIIITHHAIRKLQNKLRSLGNEGMMEQFLNDMELKVGEAISSQIGLWI